MLDSKAHHILGQSMAVGERINFSQYMSLALYHPNKGYYMRHGSVFGQQGDFVTAPLLSPILSKAIVAWLCEQGVDDVLELGPGSGVLANQILEQMPGLRRYCLCDMNPGPSKDLVGDPRAVWVDQVPQGFSGAVIANEWLDALPFHRYCWDIDQGLQEFLVKRERAGYQLVLEPAVVTPEIKALIEQFSPSWPSPYVFEYASGYGQALGQMARSEGPWLLLDYGYEREEYYHPDRMLGTLLCIENHQVVPFSLAKTGVQDLTCAVEWTLVEECAAKAGYQLAQFGTQADFIMAHLGSLPLTARDKKLLLPFEMGQYIKVAAFDPKCSAQTST